MHDGIGLNKNSYPTILYYKKRFIFPETNSFLPMADQKVE